ncbi:MAG: hypothetical protein NAOJABEB_01040 [Steroidobacteraceae bacterium]|nr:hypothetical protein [Steroidobacteraceae bacterium]
MADDSFSVGGVALRFVFALLLVALTFNPSGHSYFHWVAAGFPAIDAVKALAGIVLLIGWVVFLTATARSLGIIGVLLALAFFAALVWVAVQFGWLDTGNTRALTWIGLVVAAAILAMGMSWSHVRRRLTGQADVDEVDSR